MKLTDYEKYRVHTLLMYMIKTLECELYKMDIEISKSEYDPEKLKKI